MKLLHEREENYPHDGDAMKVSPGGSGEEVAKAVSLNSFYDKVQKKLAWMTLPDIWDIIYEMQSAPTNEPASPYLTELQARISFSITTFTFIVVGVPLAIQTQRRETSFGVVITFLIVLLYYVLGAVGRALKAHAGLYPNSSSGRRTSSSGRRLLPLLPRQPEITLLKSQPPASP